MTGPISATRRVLERALGVRHEPEIGRDRDFDETVEWTFDAKIPRMRERGEENCDERARKFHERTAANRSTPPNSPS